MSDEEVVSADINLVINNILGRLGNTESNIEELYNSIRSLNGTIEDFQQNTTSLTIASMLVMLKAVGIEPEKMDETIKLYLKLGKSYAKGFIEDNAEDEPDELVG